MIADASVQAPHRRVNEVADAGHKHARYERLRHQKQDAPGMKEPLSDDANLVRPEIEETIEISTRVYSLKVKNCIISVKHAPSSLTEMLRKQTLHTNIVGTYRNETLYHRGQMRGTVKQHAHAKKKQKECSRHSRCRMLIICKHFENT